MCWVVLYPSPLFSTCYHRLQKPPGRRVFKGSLALWCGCPTLESFRWTTLESKTWCYPSGLRRFAIWDVFLFICVIFLGKGKGEPAYFLHNCLILELDWVSSGEFSVFGTVWGCIYGYMILVLPFWVVHSCRYCPVVSTYGPNWIGSKLDPNFSHLLVVAVWHENPAKSPPVHSWKLMAGTSKSLNWKGK